MRPSERGFGVRRPVRAVQINPAEPLDEILPPPSTRKRRLRLQAAGLTGLLLLTPLLRGDEFSRVFHYHARLFSYGTFILQARTGDIQITGWDNPHVEIEAEKVVHAKSKGGAEPLYHRVRILLQGQDREVRLRTLYPPRRPWRPFRGESKLSVNFRIHMPYDSNLVLRCVDGDVWIRGVVGQEEIHVNYGDVEVDVPSLERLRSLRAKTWLGNVLSDLHGEDSAGFGRRVDFWNPQGTQDIKVKVHMGGIYIYQGE